MSRGDNSRRITVTASVVGVVLQLAGLRLDAALHDNDPTLAAREGVSTLTNPGHLLFIVGLALTVVGVGAGHARPLSSPGQLVRRAGGSKGLISMVMLVLLAGSALVVTSSDQRHRGEDDSAHGGQEPVAVGWDRLREINHMLALTEAATMQYSDVARARGDGYRQLTYVYPGTGAHFVDLRGLAAGTFDLTRPPVLLYDGGAEEGWELVGVAWVLPGGPEEPPPSVFAPLARWHYHDEAERCFRPRGPDAVGELSTRAACAGVGGVFVERGHWMLHAWLFRPSPEGVLAGRNSTIKGAHPFD